MEIFILTSETIISGQSITSRYRIDEGWFNFDYTEEPVTIIKNLILMETNYESSNYAYA
jgi:hypothetical protein